MGGLPMLKTMHRALGTDSTVRRTSPYCSLYGDGGALAAVDGSRQGPMLSLKLKHVNLDEVPLQLKDAACTASFYTAPPGLSPGHVYELPGSSPDT